MGACMGVKTTHDFAHVILTKSPEEMGYGMFIKRDEKRRIRIVSIDEGGPMDQWNEEHPDQRVEVGDRIINIDGGIARDALFLWTLANQRGHIEVSMLVIRERHPERAKAEDLLMEFLKDSTEVEGDQTCAICLDQLSSEEAAVVLPCGHAFHYECSKSWLNSRRNHRGARCCTCRQKIAFSADVSPVSSSGSSSSTAATPSGSEKEVLSGVFEI